MPKVSICMSSYNRSKLLARTLSSIAKQTFKDLEVIVCEDGDDDGNTRAVCAVEWPFLVRYYQRKRRPNVIYSNPAIPNNIALKRATGEITVLQNAECKYTTMSDLEKLVELVKEKNAVFANVWSADEEGKYIMWFCHHSLKREPWYFCGTMRTEHFHNLRGFDEDYLYYGMDDVDFADRMALYGIKTEWPGIVTLQHQWHERPSNVNYEKNAELYKDKTAKMAAGILRLQRNDENWGEE